ncbi:MAG: outer membrane lipoprotein-sorting protein, partial [Thermoanaerobaculia bacterium]|nr:outer membrane lipoprotein-sorting protein [Thermoanaerobaculia bacterium]
PGRGCVSRLGAGLNACLGLAAFRLVVAGAPAGADADPEVQALLQRMDDLYRGDETSHGTVTMRVKTSRFEREMTMETWTEGTENTLVRILEPARDRGMATLKVEHNIWNYLPKVDRTIKVPVSMMSGSWMGSHFSNDDLTNSSRFSRDYDCTAIERPETNDGKWVIECIPKEDAVVVYGKSILRIDAETEIAEELADYDERGNLARTMTLSEIDREGDRIFPRRSRIVPADKPGEYTEMIYDEIRFDVELPADTFSLRSLRR